MNESRISARKVRNPPVSRRPNWIAGLSAKCLPLPLAALTPLEVGQPDNRDAAEGKPPEAPPTRPPSTTTPWGSTPASCIGCGRCAEACKTENDVPREPFYFRTWIERYVIQTDGDDRGDQSRTAASAASPDHAKPASCGPSSSPSSATTAPARPACRSARWAPRSPPRTAWCWWTRPTASAAGIASRLAPMAPDSSTPSPTRPRSAPSATTAWSRDWCPPASRSVPPRPGSSAT